MQRLLTIAWLTWKAAFRFRLFLVLVVLLLASVVGLPLLIQDDGTARGFTQILLTYTLSAITGLLGLSTLWLACGTLARDIEECQIQVLATKPVARWQIWAGKWLGIMGLNAVLLAISGASVYALLQWRAAELPVPAMQELRSEGLDNTSILRLKTLLTRQDLQSEGMVAREAAGPTTNELAINAEIEQALRERMKNHPEDAAHSVEVREQIKDSLTRLASLLAVQQELRSQVLVARGSAKDANHDQQIAEATEKTLQDRLKNSPVEGASIDEVRKQISAQMKGEFELAPPGYSRNWLIDLGHPQSYFQNQPMQLRIKFNTANNSASGTFIGMFRVGDVNSTNYWQSDVMHLAPDTFHEFAIPANLCDAQGRLAIEFDNANPTALLFPLDDGIEVLYPEGSFTLNFARGLGIILCWMALLTALGLSAASFLSFPVAAFFSLAMLLVGLSSGTLAEAVDSGSVAAGNEETGAAGHSAADVFLIPAFKATVTVVSLAKNFSPIDSLSTGRSITWSDLGTAFLQIVVILGGAIALVGIFLFNRRELATAQGTQ